MYISLHADLRAFRTSDARGVSPTFSPRVGAELARPTSRPGVFSPETFRGLLGRDIPAHARARALEKRCSKTDGYSMMFVGLVYSGYGDEYHSSV